MEVYVSTDLLFINKLSFNVLATAMPPILLFVSALYSVNTVFKPIIIQQPFNEDAIWVIVTCYSYFFITYSFTTME